MGVYNAENLYLNRAKFVMKFLGVWVPPENETVGLKLHRFLMLSLQYLFLIFQIVYIIQVWGDLEAVSQASYLLFTQACLCFKVTVFLCNKEMCRSLLGQMASDVFKPENKNQELINKRQAIRIKRLLLAFMVSSQATCGLWALKPLFDDNVNGSREFPFRMWMPVDTNQSPHYEIGYACQLLAISMSAYMYFGVDSVALSMVIFGCAQMEVIKDKLMTIKIVNRNYKSDTSLVQNKLLDENYDKFIKCVEQYQAVVRFTKELEDAFHTYLVFQLSGSVGLICMSALRILVV
uniref:Putative odorant receptor 16 n=1 Tax=Conopomorpha sinensis TaxID=940481 RepID=A0A3S7SGQ1_9NEOP|nr:putative odorant receptor 16 [Conopomorpha sinensis]